MFVTIMLVAFYCSYNAVIAIKKNDCPSALPRDKYLKTHGDKCYYFHFEEERDFPDAKDICYNSGGSLALVKTKDINNFLHIALAFTYADKTTNMHKGLWIGLTDLEQEGHYKWMDGSPMDYENFDLLQGPYRYLIGTVEDCVAMDPDSGKWHDYHCESFLFVVNEERPFICEYQAEVRTTLPPTTLRSTLRTTLSPTTLRSTLLTTLSPTTIRSTLRTTLPPHTLKSTLRTITENDCPPALPRDKYLKTHGDKCYYFHIHKERDFSEAKDICYNSGGSLALVKTKDINSFLHTALAYDLKDETSKMYKNLWIGLTDLEQEGHYKWMDGSPMDYENFDLLQGPHGFLIGTVEDCVAMDPDSGKWHDYHCESFLFVVSEERPFICEHQAEVRTTLPPTTLQPTTLRSTLRTTLPPTTLRSTLRTTLPPTTLRSTLRTTLPPTTLRSTLRTTLPPTTLRSTLRTTLPPTTLRSTLRTTLPPTTLRSTLRTTLPPTTLRSTLRTTLPPTTLRSTLRTTLPPTTLRSTLRTTLPPTTLRSTLRTTLPPTTLRSTLRTTLPPTTLRSTLRTTLPPTTLRSTLRTTLPPTTLRSTLRTTLPPTTLRSTLRTTLPPTTLNSAHTTTKRVGTVRTTKGRTPSTMASTTPSITTKKVTSPVVPLLTGKIVILQQSTETTQPSTNTRPVPTTCLQIMCNKECGPQGYQTDPVTGCLLCECEPQ